MTEQLRLSPLAEIAMLGEEKITLSVLGRRYTVEDRFGMIKGILDSIENGDAIDDIITSMSVHYPPDALKAAIKSLIDTKVLVNSNERAGGDSTHSLLAHRRELDGNIASGSSADFMPENWAVLVAGQGQLADAMCKSFIETGIEVKRVDSQFDGPLPALDGKRAMMLVCSDDEDFGLFRKMNAVAVEHGVTCLFLGIDWSTVQCGPLVMPKATACYECFYHRVRSTRKFATEFDARSNPDNFLYRAIPSKLAIHWAVAEGSRIVLQFLSGTLANLHQSTFSEIDIFDGAIGRSAVLRLPRCPVCGIANTARPVGTVYQHALMRRRA